jgi:hypothetical protein
MIGETCRPIPFSESCLLAGGQWQGYFVMPWLGHAIHVFPMTDKVMEGGTRPAMTLKSGLDE